MPVPATQYSETNTVSVTVTDNITTLQFASVDNNSNVANLSPNNPIPAGQLSYEKWIRMKLTTASTNSVSAFGVWFTAGNITDGGGGANVTAKYGVNGAFATPVNTASSVATSATTGDVSSPGTSFTAPANTTNAYSGYITLQLNVGAGAQGGNMTFPANWINTIYTYS
jgi:hypothetical protein